MWGEWVLRGEPIEENLIALFLFSLSLSIGQSVRHRHASLFVSSAPLPSDTTFSSLAMLACCLLVYDVEQTSWVYSLNYSSIWNRLLFKYYSRKSGEKWNGQKILWGSGFYHIRHLISGFFITLSVCEICYHYCVYYCVYRYKMFEWSQSDQM